MLTFTSHIKKTVYLELTEKSLQSVSCCIATGNNLLVHYKKGEYPGIGRRFHQPERLFFDRRPARLNGADRGVERIIFLKKTVGCVE